MCAVRSEELFQQEPSSRANSQNPVGEELEGLPWQSVSDKSSTGRTTLQLQNTNKQSRTLTQPSFQQSIPLPLPSHDHCPSPPHRKSYSYALWDGIPPFHLICSPWMLTGLTAVGQRARQICGSGQSAICHPGGARCGSLQTGQCGGCPLRPRTA